MTPFKKTLLHVDVHMADTWVYTAITYDIVYVCIAFFGVVGHIAIQAPRKSLLTGLILNHKTIVLVRRVMKVLVDILVFYIVIVFHRENTVVDFHQVLHMVKKYILKFLTKYLVLL